MRHRVWLLLLPALTLVYWIVLTIGPLINTIPWLVMSRDRTDMVMYLGLAGLLSWTALEITAHRSRRAAPVCECGYSLSGLPCPECGQPIGEPPHARPPSP
ncbi:MAG: hypothetical protein KDB18_12750 [Salinibacterium sp.]|nr:hypothetical protein [Salinibacterium sp.]